MWHTPKNSKDHRIYSELLLRKRCKVLFIGVPSNSYSENVIGFGKGIRMCKTLGVTSNSNSENIFGCRALEVSLIIVGL